MKYLSMCSGIEAASVAWKPLGWEPVAFSEIEPFPCAVLKHHYPDVPNLGDMNGYRCWPALAPDLLVGGTPCQSFSVAGLRKGLADPRGNLALVFLGLVDRFRPRWVVWENVPGVRSSLAHDAPDPCEPPDGMAEGSEWVGEDEYDADESHAFFCFLAGLSELGYGWAYRSLDAQYFGLAQRRERVFVVGYSGDWRPPAAALFEPDSLSGDSAPRRDTRERIAPRAIGSLTGSGRGVERVGESRGQDPIVIMSHDPAPTLMARERKGPPREADLSAVVTHALRADGFDALEDGTGRGTPLVVDTLTSNGDAHSGYRDEKGLIPFDTTQITSKANRSQPKAGDPCHPLAAGAHVPTVAYAIQERAICENPGAGPDGVGVKGDGTTYTLEARSVPQAVAIRTAQTTANGHGLSSDVAHTLDGANGQAVAHETLYLQGITHQGFPYAGASKVNANSVLSGVRHAIGEEAFAEWGLGILDSLQPSPLLRSAVHGANLRLPPFTRRWVVCCALGSPFSRAEGAVRSLREAQREGRSPPGWEPSEQLAEELGTYLSELSQPGPQAERFVRDLWEASEGAGLLRQALSAFQEMGRPANREAEPAHRGTAVRRLTPTECEFLQGFPRGYTQVPYRGKPAADGPRYKALGNSMAVPVVRWLGERIQLVESLHPEKAA